VAGTMVIARMAGIRIFATGGTGGVHREARDTFDISADLFELARTPVAVVSSGVKSILDIGATLEYLETLGVPVVGYGTEEFPAFYSVRSGFRLHQKVNSPAEAAHVIKTHFDLNLQNGLLIANPVPVERKFRSPKWKSLSTGLWPSNMNAVLRARILRLFCWDA